MAAGERFVRAFHDAQPGVTSAAFASGGSYARLAAAVPRASRRVLDLACGDGELLALLPNAIGLDLSAGELARAHGRAVVQGRAQQLPFAAAAFDAVTCHLALMLFEELDAVADELARVLAPGGGFYAILGGGPVAGDDDGLYERWLAATRPLRADVPPLGDRRASREDGWRALLTPRGFTDIAFERFEIELAGDAAFAMLTTSYICAHIAPDALTAAFADLGPPISLRAVLWLARATRQEGPPADS